MTGAITKQMLDPLLRRKATSHPGLVEVTSAHGKLEGISFDKAAVVERVGGNVVDAWPRPKQ